MSLPKINLSDNQKKIIAVNLTVVFIFLFFWVFLFLPASGRITLLKNELALTQQQIQGIEALLTGASSRDEAIRLLEQKKQYLSNKFPPKEEESLRLIPELARKMNIEVISIVPGKRAELLDAAGKQIVVTNQSASYLPITLQVSCYFKDLVKYVLELKTALPAFISVNSLEINKAGQSAGKIQANFEFNLYLLN